jgi:hypothetical protein
MSHEKSTGLIILFGWTSSIIVASPAPPPRAALSPVPLSSSSQLLPTHPRRLAPVLPSRITLPRHPRPPRPPTVEHMLFHRSALCFVKSISGSCLPLFFFILFHILGSSKSLQMSWNRQPPLHWRVDSHALATTVASSGLVPTSKRPCVRAILHVPDFQLCT